jgi:beta-lactamase class A
LLIAALVALTLTDQFAALERRSGGHVGICAEAVEGGPPRRALHGAERFPMQSVYKLPIAMAVLDAVDRRVLTLDQKLTLRRSDMADVHFHSPLRDRYPDGGIDVSLRDLLRAAIADSDGVASDALYRLAGGGPRITAYLRSLGIRDIAVVATEREMSKDPMVQYRNYATPCAAVALLRTLQAGRGFSADARALLLKDLTESGPGEKRLKGMLPPGTVVAHKTGTDSTRDGLTRATNDVGLITLPDGRHLAIAVLVKDSTADETTRERAIAEAARLAYDAWTTK